MTLEGGVSMLTDPIAVDANTPNPALSFSVIRSDGYGSERRDSGGLYGLKISHSTSKNGDRHYIQMTKTIDATNPYNDLVSPQSASVSISIASPAFGFDSAAMAALFQALTDTIAADDFGGIAKLIDWQS
jgi:hypothetical protein